MTNETSKTTADELAKRIHELKHFISVDEDSLKYDRRAIKSLKEQKRELKMKLREHKASLRALVQRIEEQDEELIQLQYDLLGLTDASSETTM